MSETYIPEPFQFQMDEAVSVESSTCLAFGNCFSVRTASGKCCRIVNFYLDAEKNGLEMLVQAGLTWPIAVAILGEGVAVIHDKRIASKHYRNRFCEVCCPMELLPIQQRLEMSRSIMMGITSFSKAPNIIKSVRFGEQ